MIKLKRILGLSIGLAAAVVACYKPDIADNKLFCGGTLNDQCPDGFHCVSGRCRTSGGVGGTGGTVNTGGTGGTNPMCLGPLPGTTPQNTGMCDPVSQTGCADCTQRCNIVGKMQVCQNPPAAGNKVSELCSFSPTDTCDPGLICLGELQPVCGAHCYRYCRKDGDCTDGAHCVVPLSFGDMELTQLVCDVPPVTCLPYKGTANCAKGEGFGCYLAGARFPEEVVCDCAGTLEEGQDCTIERAECKPGFICAIANPGSGESAKCRAVCPLNNPALAKQVCNGAMCVPYANSSKYGFCK